MNPLFEPWRIRFFCGQTLHQSSACVEALGFCRLSPELWPSWQAAALHLHRHLASQQAVLRSWLAQVQSASAASLPLETWLTGLLRALRVPDYPLQVQQDLSGRLVVVSACPYPRAVHDLLLAVTPLLEWAACLLQRGQVQVPEQTLRPWLGRLARLATLLPPAEVMNFHKGLDSQRIDWFWDSGRLTRVGQGARQKAILLPDAADGAEVAAALLAAAELPQLPIYTVTGSVGKTTTVRLLSQLLQGCGLCLAVAASDGAWVGGRQISRDDCIGGRSAAALLRRPEVEVALFEQGRGGLLKQGVPYRRSSIAVLLNVQDVHLGLDGVDSLAAMAEVKAVGLRPAHRVVLNFDDAQCRRLAERWPAGRLVWFSVTAEPARLQQLSHKALGVLGVERTALGQPLGLCVYQQHRVVARLSLQDVLPYQGMLGEKTLEELLAAVGAAWFGPVALTGWERRLPALRLDAGNHLFRASVQRAGAVFYVLDKAGEKASLAVLAPFIDSLCRREGIRRRILVMTRSAGEPPQRHLESCRCLYPLMDEFVCFDRPETYQAKTALPLYAAGDLPRLLTAELLRLGQQAGHHKPVQRLEDWSAVEPWLEKRLCDGCERTLVLINQPSTAAAALNERIAAFVRRQMAITKSNGGSRNTPAL
ncbi:Mur ligase middle domain-containing protein [Desulfuromonas thiophila]|uniref:Mur ligase middle domain-containing protein n=1 Tax=Desulfuromonas thiophila TaxID=57664 RepID=A0A1G7EX94_9BACT|nr:Mur ligase middle domain-containing protein [Desulfuromonas thiophila]